jgi:hypothetical protein
MRFFCFDGLIASGMMIRNYRRSGGCQSTGPKMNILLTGFLVLAHSWYPWACCHDQHCHPVPCETIKADRLGLSWNGVIFTPEMIKDSLDEHCHVCVDTVGRYRYPYCVFIPKPKPA